MHGVHVGVQHMEQIFLNYAFHYTVISVTGWSATDVRTSNELIGGVHHTNTWSVTEQMTNFCNLPSSRGALRYHAWWHS